MKANIFNLVFANFILIKGKVVSTAPVTWDVAVLEEQEYELMYILILT